MEEGREKIIKKIKESLDKNKIIYDDIVLNELVIRGKIV
jgi:hypothetical protein